MWWIVARDGARSLLSTVEELAVSSNTILLKAYDDTNSLPEHFNTALT
jgi:hypothetical protein